jgi:Na+-transporting methylmalonyl-CoA/oxaloacetate decarboxylase gamma subunit
MMAMISPACTLPDTLLRMGISFFFLSMVVIMAGMGSLKRSLRKRLEGGIGKTTL